MQPKTLPIIEDNEIDLNPINRALAKGFPDIYWGPGTRLIRPTARSSSTIQESASIDRPSRWKGKGRGKGKATDTDPSPKISLSIGFERYWEDISNDEVFTLLHDSGLIRTVQERIEPDFYHERLIYYKAMDWTTCGMKEAKEDWVVYWNAALENKLAVLRLMNICGMEDEVKGYARREFFVGE